MVWVGFEAQARVLPHVLEIEVCSKGWERLGCHGQRKVCGPRNRQIGSSFEQWLTPTAAIARWVNYESTEKHRLSRPCQ